MTRRFFSNRSYWRHNRINDVIGKKKTVFTCFWSLRAKLLLSRVVREDREHERYVVRYNIYFIFICSSLLLICLVISDSFDSLSLDIHCMWQSQLHIFDFHNCCSVSLSRRIASKNKWRVSPNTYGGFISTYIPMRNIRNNFVLYFDEISGFRDKLIYL